ncbi:MAG: insulinase family protein, partial [Oligoflexales bacterium]|nr:insulinase family protein [Oligoflexales bacterium]
MRISETCHGFEYIKGMEIKEIQSYAKLFYHNKSGARLLKLETSDDNKLFSVTFKTLPSSDDGAAHILEHSVLNGSKNFPVKSPFKILAKGSMHTFLNAMTFPDRTMYPIASRNDKDFRNLMHVYMDAVFFPKIYSEPRIFKQEGWHLLLDAQQGELKYSGVVYNEMKGAYSMPERLLLRAIRRNLLPDTQYAFESGGYPDAIPSLSHEALISFHRRYYHPSNCYIFIYGNSSLEEDLEFINTKYLDAFQKTEVDSEIRVQAPFGKICEISESYPVLNNESDENKTFLSLSFVVNAEKRNELYYSFDIVSDALVNLSSGTIRKEILDRSVGRDIFSSYININQPIFIFTVKNSTAQKKDIFREIIIDKLGETVKKGFDRSVLEGLVNRLEFSLREANYSPRGLIYNYRALEGWIYDNDPFASLG